MLKTLLAAVSVAFLVGTASASDFETISKSTVPFLINGEKTCSAVLIPPEDTVSTTVNKDGTKEMTTITTGVRVVTAKHCTTDVGARFSIATPKYDKDGRIVSETTYLLSKPRIFGTRDVALFTFEDDSYELNNLPYADVVAERDLKFGDFLTHIGYPQSDMEATGLHQTVTDGRFQEYTYNEGKPTYIRTDVPAWYGSSGGGLWKNVDGDYQLVGITSKGDVNGAAWMFTFYTPVEISTLK